MGGLLARTDGSGSTYYHADAAGNITAMADASGNVVARYLYDPFGNLLGKWGALADANRYRFSSKEVHPNSGLYYYGYRFYEPNLQRWMNRDPIGEAGGINLYRAVLNAPGNVFDSDGLSTGNFYAGSSPGFNPSYGVDNAPVNMVFTMNINRGANGNVNFLSDASYDYAGTDPMAVFALQTELMNPITGPLLAAVAVQQGYKDATNPNLDPLTRTGGACTALGNGIMLGLGAKASLGKCLGTMAAEGADAEVGALATKCSPAGTKVSTPDGDVNIEDIKVGDTVYGCDLETGETVERKVTELLRNSTYHWVDVQVGSEMIRATRSHPFWVENKHDWVEAANLRVGMVVRLESGQPVAITSVSIVDLQQPQPTYNLEVAVDHDYFVSGLHVLVHNGDGSYTITFASGKQYVGKGDLSRMADSAARISAQTGDPVVNTQ
jgi:RHS repeat-associated protein